MTRATAVADETQRRAALLQAEGRALALLDMIEAAGLIDAGRSEREVAEDIYALAQRRFGVKKHWHKRIVRSGPNTLAISSDNPPLRNIDADDTVFIDLGPVFDDWEADVGRTYALGADPAKHRLVADLPMVFARVQAHFQATPGITGADLYAFAQEAAVACGWEFGGAIAGHLVSEFPHARLPGDKELNRISPRNPQPMRDPDTWGRTRHWILEIHLVDAARTFGGFYERLL